jgi:UDP-glucose:(heptosyl)LPS alpha-1,3-glucosyltransferase
LGLGGLVTFVGPTKRVSALLFGADVCVHPTYYDPCSRVVLEALSLGVPVITTAFNGAAEVIQDGREGFVIETPDDVGLWARRIEDLASLDLRSRMSERALALREKISMARHVGELETMFEDIVERKRSAATRA